MLLQPLPLRDIKELPYTIQEWFRKLSLMFQAGNFPWNFLNFTGSNITSIETRHHNDLQNIDGSPGTYHLSNVAATKAENFDESAQDAVGGILINSGTVPLNYNDVANTITASLSGTVTASGPVSNTHEVALQVNGTTYYLLARIIP